MIRHARYSPEVDGLRAVAVLSVLLFHLEPTWMPGGFTGVDIFLVISGFLITSQVAESRRLGNFSLGTFYLRRIRRIAPAYMVVVVASLLAGCLLMLPEDLAHTARAAMWSVVSLPNVFFWLYMDTGYFAPDTNQQVLLHLWSLGVEEQFYLLWPVCLLLLLRCRTYLRIALVILGVAVSIGLAEWFAGADPAFAYYMLPTRAGELGIGALLALAATRGTRTDASGRIAFELLACAGFLLIVIGLVSLDASSRFPGLNSLYPCLGTALIILAGSRQRCLVLAPLRSRPVVAVGLVSYSLYLWHWPVLAYARYLGVPMTPKVMLALVLVIAVVSLASYALIERPARRAQWKPRTQLLGFFVVPVGILIALSAWIQSSDGRIPGAMRAAASPAAERVLLARTAPAYAYADNCQLSEFDPEVLSRAACVHGNKNQAMARRDLLWGDSHAAHYIGVVGALAEATGTSVRNASFSTCPPVWGAEDTFGSGVYRAGCTRFRALIDANINDYATIYLGAQWSQHQRIPAFAARFEQTVVALVNRGHKVVLLAEAPSFDGFDRNCEIRSIRSSLVDCRAVASRTFNRHLESRAWLTDIASRHAGVSLIDPGSVLCPDGRCSPYLGEQPVYFDRTHLSMEGSWRVGRRFVAEGAADRSD